MDLELIPATDADWDRAWPIQREAFRDLVTRTHGGWDEVQTKKCAEAWDATHTRLIEVDGALAGWVRVEHHPDRDWLDLVVVDPRVQGRGLGTRVMWRLMGEARDRGVALWLSVYRANAARRLYARLGFAELPRDEIRVYMVWPGAPADVGRGT